MLDRIHITGAAGAGVTTLGRALAERLGLHQIDTDDIYWLPTEPPYQAKRPAPDRLAMLHDLFRRNPRWVLSGSLAGWGDPLISEFRLVLYLYTPVEIRLARLRQRETARFGPSVQPGGARHQEYLDFLDWAASYDTGATEGRDRFKHAAWLARLPCPVLRLDGAEPVAMLVRQVTEFIAGPAQGIPPSQPIR